MCFVEAGEREPRRGHMARSSRVWLSLSQRASPALFFFGLILSGIGSMPNSQAPMRSWVLFFVATLINLRRWSAKELRLKKHCRHIGCNTLRRWSVNFSAKNKTNSPTLVMKVCDLLEKFCKLSSRYSSYILKNSLCHHRAISASRGQLLVLNNNLLVSTLPNPRSMRRRTHRKWPFTGESHGKRALVNGHIRGGHGFWRLNFDDFRIRQEPLTCRTNFKTNLRQILKTFWIEWVTRFSQSLEVHSLPQTRL